MKSKLVKQIHADLNARYFAGVLPMPKFIKFSGTLEHGDKIGTNGAYDNGKIWYHRKLKGKTLRDTIAHEMAHQFQEFSGWHNNLTDEEKTINGDAYFWHGQDFEIFTALMKRDGLKI